MESNVKVSKVVEVVFEKCSEAVRIGLGRPYFAATENGDIVRRFSTWNDPAPKVGDEIMYVKE
jgi:hypothetical protein